APDTNVERKASSRYGFGLGRHVFLVRYGASDQVVEGAERSLGAVARRDDDLLVGHGRAIARGEHARQGRLALGVDLDLAVARQSQAALEPLGIGHQADLHEDAFQLDVAQLVGDAILVRQAAYLLAVAVDLGRLRRDHDVDIGQALELALQYRISAQAVAVLD